MAMKNIVRDVREGLGRSLSRRRRRSAIASASSRAASCDFDFAGVGCEGGGGGGEGRWASLPPELLRDVVARLEASESTWPDRRNVVACAAVCRSWRRMCKEIVKSPEISSKLTFPISLKQPGPRSELIQCYIRRNKATSTYHLYLGLNPENGKFLLAARKIRRPTHAEYIISLDFTDIQQNSVNYMGKLRSNFLGTKFVVYDSHPTQPGVMTSTCHSSSWFYGQKVSPKIPSASYGIAQVAYELNMLGARGPRRMRCTMQSIPASAVETNGSILAHIELPNDFLDDSFSNISLTQSEPLNYTSEEFKSFESSSFCSSKRLTEVSLGVFGNGSPLVLRNKAPRWHEQLQCWCLNFRGRVTVASVKNFQLIAASECVDNKNATSTRNDTTFITATRSSSNPGSRNSQVGSSDQDKIILQFGKVGQDLFTMDYRYPLSAFQAFGICLSSFDTKIACE